MVRTRQAIDFFPRKKPSQAPVKRSVSVPETKTTTVLKPASRPAVNPATIRRPLGARSVSEPVKAPEKSSPKPAPIVKKSAYNALEELKIANKSPFLDSVKVEKRPLGEPATKAPVTARQLADESFKSSKKKSQTPSDTMHTESSSKLSTIVIIIVAIILGAVAGLGLYYFTSF